LFRQMTVENLPRLILFFLLKQKDEVRVKVPRWHVAMLLSLLAMLAMLLSDFCDKTAGAVKFATFAR